MPNDPAQSMVFIFLYIFSKRITSLVIQKLQYTPVTNYHKLFHYIIISMALGQWTQIEYSIEYKDFV